MKYLPAVACLLLASAFGCQQSSDNIPIVESYVNSVESLDYETMASLLSEDYMGLGPSAHDTIYKAEAVESWKYNVDNLYEKIEYTRSQFAALTISEGPNSGEWVSHWSELNITYQDGAKAKIWSNSVYKVEGGKIIRTFTFYNEADVLDQLGYVFIKP